MGLLCHIPFVFFGAKLSFLAVVEEIWHKTLSKAIDKRILDEEEKLKALEGNEICI